MYIFGQTTTVSVVAENEAKINTIMYTLQKFIYNYKKKKSTDNFFSLK